MGWLEDLEQGVGTVGVAPLQVVDEPNDGCPVTDCLYQRPQPTESSRADLLLVHLSDRNLPSLVGQDLGLLQDRKDLSQDSAVLVK